MRHQQFTPSKVGAILWALLLGGGFVALGASILMPSTKSARIVPPDTDGAEHPATNPSQATPATQPTQPARRRELLPGSKSAPVFAPPAQEASQVR